MGSSTARLIVVLAASAALLLSGCGGDDGDAGDKVSRAQAQKRYPDVVRAVADKLGGEFQLTWQPHGRAVVQDNGNGCTWYAGELQSASWLAKDGDWTSVIDAVNPVLSKHGFGEVKGEDSDQKGGFTGIKAHDDHRAVLRVFAKGQTFVSLQVPVDGSC